MNRQKVALSVLVVAVVVAAFFVGRLTNSPSTAPSAPSPAVETAIKVSAPWTANGTISSQVHVTSHVSGSCYSGSLAVSTPGAYRCTAGNDLYDPCFAEIDGSSDTQVACEYSPWGGVAVMKLTKPLPTSSDGNSGIASGSPAAGWAIVLANGAQCVVGTGANSEVSGVDFVYYCGKRGQAGPIDKSHQPWTVEFDRAGADQLDPVVVTVAWAG